MTAMSRHLPIRPYQPSGNTVFAAHNLDVNFATKYGQTRALDDVSIRIDSGQAVGIVGESGSGKTTLTRALVGLAPPARGRVLYRNQDIYALKDADRFRLLGRHTALVFQDPRSSLNPRLSVGAIVRDPLAVLRIGNRTARNLRVDSTLESVGIPATMSTRPVRSLSGGQLQRVALARALVVEPDVIIADEPTSALDVSIQAQILNLLQELRHRRNFALLIVSHDIHVIHFLTDRMIVMHKGKIVEEGPTIDLYNNPQHSYTKELLSAAPTILQN